MSTTRSVGIEVEGLRQFMRGLRQAPERLDKDIRKEFREIAATVRDRARAAAWGRRSAVGGGPKRVRSMQSWRDLVNTIRSGSNPEPYVALGSDRVPWVLGHEFGSGRYPQFPPWRGNKADAGYFFYPAVRAETQNVVERMAEVVDRVLSEAYPEQSA
jgi:hypothetical protein